MPYVFKTILAASIFLFAESTSVFSKVPDGPPVNMLACVNAKAAEAFAVALVEKSEWPGNGDCIVFNAPAFIAQDVLDNTPVFIGPLVDWEGDTFVVYVVTRADNESQFYPFVWFPKGTHPTNSGFRI